MKYDIQVVNKPNKKSMAKLSVFIDRVPELAVPTAIHMSIGNKENMYRKYIEQVIFNKDDNRLLNILVRIHDKAIEMNGLEIVCNCRYNKFHANVIKEVLENNSEMFTNLISYIVPDSKNKSVLENKDVDETATGTESVKMGGKTTLENLNVEGADQLRELIKNTISNDLTPPEQNLETVQADNTQQT